MGSDDLDAINGVPQTLDAMVFTLRKIAVVLCGLLT